MDEKVVESDSEYTTDELIVEVRVKRRTIFFRRNKQYRLFTSIITTKRFNASPEIFYSDSFCLRCYFSTEYTESGQIYASETHYQIKIKSSYLIFS